MSPRPRADRDAKRRELSLAAQRVFAERGVANTAVSDIVASAGVAQGTFYLYFDSKEEVIRAVVDQAVGARMAAVETAVARPECSAVEKMLLLPDAFGVEGDHRALELVDFLHRPENRALHDRVTEDLPRRLFTIMERIVAQGVAEGTFTVPDIEAAAWFVLAGLQSVELAGTPAALLKEALDDAVLLALRALGYREEPR